MTITYHGDVAKNIINAYVKSFDYWITVSGRNNLDSENSESRQFCLRSSKKKVFREYSGKFFVNSTASDIHFLHLAKQNS